MTTDPAMRIADAMAVLEPPPALTVSEWADAELQLPVGVTPDPGPWRTDREPYQRGMMDAVHEGAETLVIMAGAQSGKTSILLAQAFYFVAHDPRPMLLIEPTEGLAKRISKNRLAPIIRATPALARRIEDTRGRNAKSTLLHKRFPNGVLMLVGANSATPLSSDPIGVLFADEIDKYPATVGEEGDPLALGMKRTTRFWNRRHVLTSTPTIKGSSRIAQWFDLSDQRRYFVPCPRCGAFFVLAWKHVEWDGGATGDPETARLICPACQGRIADHERPGMVARGEWRATAPFRGIIGFHVWEAYATRATLARIVRNFLAARSLGTDSVREWINQTLGETWEPEAEQADHITLLSRREPYTPDRLPEGVLLTVAGVDTQDDRLEATAFGFGEGDEAWVLEHRKLWGDPSRPEVWADLDRWLAGPAIDRAGRHRHLAAAAIDSAGHRTDFVYAYAAARRRWTYACPRCGPCRVQVLAIIGRPGWDRPIFRPDPTTIDLGAGREVELFTLGVDQGKLFWLSALLVPERGPGYVHLPTAVDEEYAAQITGEAMHMKRQRGLEVREWKATRPRVEALDCAVYALGMLRYLTPRYELLAERIAGPAGPATPAPAAPSPAPVRPMVSSPYLSR